MRCSTSLSSGKGNYCGWPRASGTADSAVCELCRGAGFSDNTKSAGLPSACFETARSTALVTKWTCQSKSLLPPTNQIPCPVPGALGHILELVFYKLKTARSTALSPTNQIPCSVPGRPVCQSAPRMGRKSANRLPPKVCIMTSHLVCCIQFGFLKQPKTF
jgi:hypothetical protein